MEGRVPETVRPFFFGATLVALEKPGGGVRPIAVGCTLRRLVAKIAGQLVVDEMAELLSPRQLGYGVRVGCRSSCACRQKVPTGSSQWPCALEAGFQERFQLHSP